MPRLAVRKDGVYRTIVNHWISRLVWARTVTDPAIGIAIPVSIAAVVAAVPVIVTVVAGVLFVI